MFDGDLAATCGAALLLHRGLIHLFRSRRKQIEHPLDVASPLSLQQLALVLLCERRYIAQQRLALLGQGKQRRPAIGWMRRSGDQFAAQQSSQRPADPGLVNMRSAAYFIHRDRLIGSQHHQNAQVSWLYAETILEPLRADAKNQFREADDAYGHQLDERVDMRSVLAMASCLCGTRSRAPESLIALAAQKCLRTVNDHS